MMTSDTSKIELVRSMDRARETINRLRAERDALKRQIITPQQAAKVLLEAYPQAHPDLGTHPSSPLVGPMRRFLRAIAEQESET